MKSEPRAMALMASLLVLVPEDEWPATNARSAAVNPVPKPTANDIIPKSRDVRSSVMIDVHPRSRNKVKTL